MRRREALALLGGAALAAMPSAWAQTPRARRIGFLHPRTARTDSPTLTILRPIWERLGYAAPETVLLRSAEGDSRRLPGLAAELIQLGAGVLIAVGPAAVQAASATGMPVVALDLETDPVRSGLAASLSRPGGNVTGLFLDQPSLAGKWIDLLREAAPGLERLALVWDVQTTTDQLEAAKVAARARGIEALVLEVRTLRDYEELLRGVAVGPRTGVVQLGSPGFSTLAAPVAALALQHGLPMIAFLKGYARDGILLSYGPNQELYYARAISFADRILRGEKPGDLPIEQPAQFELVINLKTAAALGLTMPRTLLAGADEVIE